MNQTIRPASSRSNNSQYSILLTVFGLMAMTAVSLVASSDDAFIPRPYLFAAVIATYLVVAFIVHLLIVNRTNVTGSTRARDLADATAAERLLALEEAGKYFGGKLTSVDMFRLVVSQVGGVLSFDACILFVIDSVTGMLRTELAQGQNAEKLRNIETLPSRGLAGKCISTGRAQFERRLLESRDSLPTDALEGFRSSAAVPLKQKGHVFAVLQFLANSRSTFDMDSMNLLEAVAERVAPLVSSSLSFETSLTSAMTDPVTGLPNERAFRLILENQVAEAQRHPEDRSLTTIAFDVKNFDEINNRFGHSSGDRMLALIAQAVKGQLRQMDFLARSSNDEFLVILPTADEVVATEIISRITGTLSTGDFFVTDETRITPELYFGIAAFGRNGDTCDQLIAAAKSHKLRAKANAPVNVVWFPEHASG